MSAVQMLTSVPNVLCERQLPKLNLIKTRGKLIYNYTYNIYIIIIIIILLLCIFLYSTFRYIII